MLLSRHSEFEIFRDMVIYILSWFISAWSPWQHRRRERVHKKTPLLNKCLSCICLHATTWYNTLLNPDWGAMLFNLAANVQSILLNIISYMSNERNSTTETSKWAQYIEGKMSITWQYFIKSIELSRLEKTFKDHQVQPSACSNYHCKPSVTKPLPRARSKHL